jgi:hypothetical protein
LLGVERGELAGTPALAEEEEVVVTRRSNWRFSRAAGSEARTSQTARAELAEMGSWTVPSPAGVGAE